MDLQVFFASIHSHTLVLTPNRRLANTWHHLFATHVSEKISAWERPLMLPLMTWLEQFYQQIALPDDPQLLKPWQEQLIWEKQFLKIKPGSHPIAITEFARTAIKSFALCQEWQLDIASALFAEQEASALFQNCFLNVREKYFQKNFISIYQLPALIIRKLLNTNNLLNAAAYLPKHIILLGFQKNHLSKQFLHLMTILNQLGVTVEWENHFHHQGFFQKISFPDLLSEYTYAARYTKKLLQTQSFSLPMACIFPNLAEDRSLIETIFLDVFEDNTLINFSAGAPLNQEPIIHFALELLSLTPESPLESWLYLLTSPFLGWAQSELSERAKLKRELQEHYPPYWTLASFCESSTRTACPVLKKLFEQWLTLFRQAQANSHAQWLLHFSDILKSLGFPGDRSFNSREHQSIQEWRSVWHRLLLLDQIILEKNRKRVLHRLRDLTEQTVFQIQTPQAPIQILGTLEGAGLPFSHIWLTGIHDKNWPPAPSPAAFIPIALQKQLHMPHATAERELTFCRDLLSLYFTHSPSGLISHTERIQDQTFSSSFLVRDCPDLSISALDLSIPPSRSELLFQERNVNEFIDDQVRPLIPDKEIDGGVRILEDQALCPFRAFAIHRCHAKPQRNASVSLTPVQRGELLHRALELLWKQLKDQHFLLNIKSLELNQLIMELLDRAYLSLSITRSPAFITLEKNRLHQFILSWLSLEKMRPSFTVEHCELKKTIHCGELILNIRIDRIDRLEDGGILLLDYKTQEYFRTQSWLDDRLSDIQLPLYAIQWSECHAIAIAQIHGKKLCFHGISAQDIGIDGLQSLIHHKTIKSWAHLIARWKNQLEQLAHDFMQGDARVYPKSIVQACQTCHLENLCRIKDEI